MRGAVTFIDLPYLCSDKDRHGNVRWYVRMPPFTVKTRIHEEPGTEEFTAVYWAIRNGTMQPAPRVDRMKRGTFGYLCNRYFASDAFKELDAVYTQRERKYALNPVILKVGKYPAVLSPKSIRDGLKKRKPGQAKKLMAALRAVYAFGIEEELVTTDPTLGIKAKRRKTKGFHTWTLEQRQQYEKCHPIGTQARTAYALGLYLAIRRSDAPLLGQRNERENGSEIRYTQQKNRNRSPVHVIQPIVKPLRDALNASQGKGFTYLETSRGMPYTIFGFGNKFNEWCKEAGLTGCSFHGLRKATAAALAEAGATGSQIKAVLGHTTTRMADVYTRDADQARMAREGLDGLYGEQIVPPRKPSGTKTRKKA